MSSDKKSCSQLKREAIIDAANKAFKQFGVQATTMDKLAKMAQVSKRTVYNHFSTKEELVLYLVSDMWQTAMLQAKVSYRPDRPLKQQLTALIKTEVDLCSSQDYMDLCRVVIGNLFYKPEALQKEVEKLCNHEASPKSWIIAAVADKKLAISDCDFAFNQLDNLLTGSCFWPQLLKLEPILDSKQQQQLIDETVLMFLNRYQIKE